ncbi:PREDICTED: helicase SRCAP-like [Calidris pugnax]|uniref:helicase SRCAP-like n=1 Tax=Calidris pugnax TaxID=198806 RepID=UPI00071CDBBB|nr:PREDICTED: helicase SRCAP-like [Calidris pugnax]
MGATRVHLKVELGAPRGGCWGSLWEVPCPIEASCPSWGAGGARGHCPCTSWCPSLAAPILPHVDTTGPQRTCLSTHHPYLVLLDPLQDTSSTPGPAQPILATVISPWSSWTRLGAHHLLLGPAGPILAPIITLVLPHPSWSPSSPGPAQPILVPIISCLAQLDPFWHPSSLPGLLHSPWCPPSPPGPAQPILAPIISWSCQLILAPILFSWSCPTHLGAHHLLLGSAGPILAPITFSCTYLGVHHLLLLLPNPSWCPSSLAWPSWTHLGTHHVLLHPPWHPPSPAPPGPTWAPSWSHHAPITGPKGPPPPPQSRRCPPSPSHGHPQSAFGSPPGQRLPIGDRAAYRGYGFPGPPRCRHMFRPERCNRGTVPGPFPGPFPGRLVPSL